MNLQTISYLIHSYQADKSIPAALKAALKAWTAPLISVITTIQFSLQLFATIIAHSLPSLIQGSLYLIAGLVSHFFWMFQFVA